MKKQQLTQFILPFLGTVGGIIGIVQSFDKFHPETMVTLIAIIILLFYFMVQSLYNAYKLARYRNYGEILDLLNSGFKEIHYLNRCEQDLSREEIIKGFEILCNLLAEAFTKITRTDCSVCIKIMQKYNSDNDIYYVTLCRDNKTGQKRRKADIISKEENIKHSLNQNTAFKKALYSFEQYFISNDLNKERSYQNTSFSIYEKYPISSLHENDPGWALPYISTIVVPIVPLKVRPEKDQEKKFNGFLCVDSKQKNQFLEEYDVPLMQGVSDGIYNTLIRFKDTLIK